MQVFPTASVRPTRLLGLLTPCAVMIGVVVLLLLPNLIMHAGSGGVADTFAPVQGQHAASNGAAAGTAPRIVR